MHGLEILKEVRKRENYGGSEIISFVLIFFPNVVITRYTKYNGLSN
jgi:hypothetical protein